MASPFELVAGATVEVVLFAIAGAALYRLWHRASFLPQRMHLLPFNRGVLLQGEQVIQVLEPGKYWVLPKQTLMPVDVRPKPLQLPPHDLLSRDQQPLRITLGGEYRIVNPVSYLRENSNSAGAFFIAIEQAFSLAVLEHSAAAMMSEPALLASRVQERIEPRAAQLGIELIALSVLNILPLYARAAAE